MNVLVLHIENIRELLQKIGIYRVMLAASESDAFAK
jgi:hypothetical protein